MPPPPPPIGAERLSQLTQKERHVFVIALNPRRLFLYPSYFMHCTHCEGVGDSSGRSIPVWREMVLVFFVFTLCFEGQCIIASPDLCPHLKRKSGHLRVFSRKPLDLYISNLVSFYLFFLSTFKQRGTLPSLGD